VDATARLVPPFLIREAEGREWQALTVPRAEEHALQSAVLPADEMPRVVNPAGGVLISANNDPTGDTFDNRALNQFRTGGGVRYLGADFDSGIRARRIARLIDERLAQGRVDLGDLQRIQADAALPDAFVFVPRILAAFTNPQALAQLDDPGAVAAAVGRLVRWVSGESGAGAPTGVEEGFDAGDCLDGSQTPPAEDEVAASVATSIFSLWRAQMVADGIDAPLARLGLPRPPSRYAHKALRHLIDRAGMGVSGVDFFAASTAGAGTAERSLRRDILILRSLETALAQLTRAFGSADPRTWRWGRLHRVQLPHPLGDAFSPISAGSPFPPPYPGLAGVPVDGGFEAVDRSTHDVRAGLVDPHSEFVFSMGPAQRLVARVGPNGIHAETALPGGVSADPDSPWFANLLGPWLVNRTVALAPGAAGDGVLLVPNRPNTGTARATAARAP